jgi:hypothetical protein
VLDTVLLVQVLLVVVLLAVFAGGGIYLLGAGRGRRRGSSDGDSPVAEPARTSPPVSPNSRDYYMRVSQEKEREIRLHLYSLDEYRDELGGDPDAARDRGIRGALKAYLPMENDWYDLPPERAARDLRLSPGDYEVDAGRGALLLRRLPHGLPASARDVLS